MIGQLGLCLAISWRSAPRAPPSEPVPLNVRATRILGAHYLEPVLPGREVTLLARKLEYDEYFATRDWTGALPTARLPAPPSARSVSSKGCRASRRGPADDPLSP